MHIALLEDDRDQRDLLAHWIIAADHTCQAYGTMQEILAALKKQRFDLLLLDWMLPDGESLEVIQWVRENRGWETSIVVLTARDDESTTVSALNSGADDYLIKPISHPILMTRLEAAFRRSRPQGIGNVRLGSYTIDHSRHQLLVENEIIPMTQKEFDLASYIFENPGKLLSRDHLLNKIWGISTDIDTRTVDTHISRLRKKLFLDGSKGWQLVSVYGYGYRLDN